MADSDPPAGLNWDMWTGPHRESQVQRKTTTTAGITFGDFPAATLSTTACTKWILPAGLSGKTYPKSVYSTGGRYAEKGVFESPDTQVAVFQFDDMVMTFELTLYTPYMLKSDQALRDSDMYPYWPQNGERIEIYGSKGLMILGRHGCGWQVFDRPKDRKPVIARAGKWPVSRRRAFRRISCSRFASRRDAERGHRRGPSQHANVPTRQHQLPARRPKIGR